jgi:peroxiredoxin
MNKYLKAASLFFLFQAIQVPALTVGDSAPDFELPQSNIAQRLSELKGKWIYLDFWASWCAPCRQSFPWMNSMQNKYAGKNIQILAINVDAKKSDADRFLNQTPASFSLAFDSKGNSAKLMELKSMPTSYLIDPQGHISLIHVGFRHEDRDRLETEFKNIVDKNH